MSLFVCSNIFLKFILPKINLASQTLSCCFYMVYSFLYFYFQTISTFESKVSLVYDIQLNHAFKNTFYQSVFWLECLIHLHLIYLPIR